MSGPSYEYSSEVLTLFDRVDSHLANCKPNCGTLNFSGSHACASEGRMGLFSSAG